MKRSPFLFLAAALLLASACTNPVEKTFGEVMAVHDSAMGHMLEIERMMKALEAEQKTLAADSAADPARAAAVQEAHQALKTGYDGMMTWMKKFRNPDARTPKGEAVAYLEQELVKVRKVQQDIDSGLRQARPLLPAGWDAAQP
ncbi:MAG: hypothetical protein NW241_14730 [Bacteroidia bacterium]|nr:hypothetical protein [Bacteroidia bacterium]